MARSRCGACSIFSAAKTGGNNNNKNNNSDSGSNNKRQKPEERESVDFPMFLSNPIPETDTSNNWIHDFLKWMAANKNESSIYQKKWKDALKVEEGAHFHVFWLPRIGFVFGNIVTGNRNQDMLLEGQIHCLSKS